MTFGNVYGVVKGDTDSIVNVQAPEQVDQGILLKCNTYMGIPKWVRTVLPNKFIS